MEKSLPHSIWSYLLACLLAGLIPGIIAKAMGHSFRRWWLFGTLVIIVTVLAIAIAAAAEPPYPSTQAQLPPRDLAASPWLNAIAARLYEQSRTAMLVRDCKVDTLDEGVQHVLTFDQAVKTLPPADQAYANRVFNAGMDQANDEFKADPTKACRNIGQAQLQEVQRLGTSRQGFWDAPGQTFTPAEQRAFALPPSMTLPPPPIVRRNLSPQEQRLDNELSATPR